MAIVKLNAQQIEELNIGCEPHRSKYPWYTTEVGEGFFVPRSDTNREDYRPAVPERLKQQGQKWRTSRTTLPETNQQGFVVIRLT